MNPILGIIAPAPTIESQPLGSAPANGQPAGDGLFAQFLGNAIAVSPPRAEFPIIGLPVIAQAGVEGDVPKINLAELIVASTEGEVVAEIAAQIPTDVAPEATIDGDIVVPSLMPIASAVVAGESKTVTADQIAIRRPAVDSMIALIENASPDAQDPGLRAELQDQIEAKLTSLVGQKSSGILINAQVEVTDDAAKALTTQSIDEPQEVAVTVKGEEFLPLTKIANKPTTTLKANLRRAFPTMKIESATARVNVQVKLNNSQNEAQAKAETPATNPRSVAISRLPIAVAPQMATAVVVPGRAAKATRVNRESQVATNASAQGATKSIADPEASVRVEPRVAIRKPVQVVLKSQGFDLEKMMNSGENAKGAIVESIAIDKSDFKVATDKQPQPVTDRSAELNGIERFKLDIKRGQIDALLKKGEIKLQLQPEHLGSLKIRLTTTPTEVNARLETSSEDARRAVEMSLPQLRENFERAGLKLNGIEVVVNEDNQSRRHHAFQQEWHGRNSGSRATANKYIEDNPASAEISHNPLSVYGGALNLVA